MQITWYGHAAFLIETGGLRIILDPYRSPDCGGYEPVSEPADLVIVSHENDRYHSHLGQVIRPFETIRALELPPGGTVFRGVEIGAVHVYESPERLAEDEVAIISLRSEGLHLVFLGDLGHPLTEPELAPIRGADIVLAAAGGPPTIDYPEIPALLEAIGPRVVIPMHFKTPRIDLNIQPVERFLESLPGVPVLRPGSSSIDIARATLPDAMTIVRLEHAR
jgi:L-ascorbate metabolism protein UlaG (beta-lactamase superfamily)